MTTSWVLREKATGKVIAETYDQKKVDALNTAKYEAVPIGIYLASLNSTKPLQASMQIPHTVSQWEIYDEEGADEVAVKLTQALVEKLDRAQAAIAAGASPWDEAYRARDEMREVMAEHVEFGTLDSDPARVLARAIQKSLDLDDDLPWNGRRACDCRPKGGGMGL